MARARAVVVSLVLVLVALPTLSIGASDPAAALAASSAGPGAAQPPRAALVPLADGPTTTTTTPGGDPPEGEGGIGECVITPGSYGGQWNVPVGGPGITVTGCDTRVGQVTASFAAFPSGRKNLVQWWNGTPITGTNAGRIISVVNDDLRSCTSSCSGVMVDNILANVPFVVTWSINESGNAWSFVQAGHPQTGTTGNMGTPTGTTPLSLLLGTYNSLSAEPCICSIRLDELNFVPWEEPEAEEEESCPSWTPDFLCDAATSIGDFTGPIIDALTGLGTTLVGALGNLGNMIVNAIGGIAAAIWEVFKVAILDPEEVGAWWDEFYADVKETNAAKSLPQLWESLESMIPTFEQGGLEGLCVDPDGEVCLGPALDELPNDAASVVRVLFYGWAFITMCYLAGQVVKTVRR